MHNKIIYSRICPSIYNVPVHILLPKQAVVQIQDESDKLILLPYVSTFYATYLHIINDK